MVGPHGRLPLHQFPRTRGDTLRRAALSALSLANLVRRCEIRSRPPQAQPVIPESLFAHAKLETAAINHCGLH